MGIFVNITESSLLPPSKLGKLLNGSGPGLAAQLCGRNRQYGLLRSAVISRTTGGAYA